MSWANNPFHKWDCWNEMIIGGEPCFLSSMYGSSKDSCATASFPSFSCAAKAGMAAGPRVWRALLGGHSRTLGPLTRPPTTSPAPSTLLSRRYLSGEGGNGKGGGDCPSATHSQGARGRPGQDAATPVDARMEEARRRFGLGAAAQSSTPIAPIPKKVERNGEEEPETDIDYNEVWGDYIDYMTHQRDKGWKT